MRVAINVTEKDIRKGCKGDDQNCPIARAVLKNLKNGYVSVDCTGQIRVSDAEDGVMVDTDTSIRRERFITKFDNGEKVKPFRFLMNIPARVVRKHNYVNQKRTRNGKFAENK